MTRMMSSCTLLKNKEVKEKIDKQRYTGIKTALSVYYIFVSFFFFGPRTGPEEINWSRE